MIDVYRIPVPKERLLALPEDERVLLLQLGYVANQVLMFEKILTYATKLDPKTEVEQFATGVQTQMLVRLGVGAVFEAMRVVERHFLSNKIGKDYADRLDQRGRDALEIIKSLLGKSALLAVIRNNYGFHYPEPKDTEAAFQAAAADSDFDQMWQVFFSQHGFNSLFLFSDAIFTHGIAAKVGAKDLPALQKQLMNEFREAALNLVEFAQACFAAMWIKHFGAEINAQDIVRIEGAPKFDEISLPFFVEIAHLV